MGKEVEIQEVKSLLDLVKFVNAEYKIKKNCPGFVPPIFIERLMLLKKSPFYKHAKVKLFIAKKGKEVVGRISAQIDELHLKKWGEKVGFFGFFDCVDEPEIAKKLFESAERFLKSYGMEKIRGQFSFNINGESGILIEGFEYPPFIMMPHNPEYYGKIIEMNGFKKAKDLYAWIINREEVEKKLSSLLKIFWKEAKGKVAVKEITKRTLEEDIKATIEIYNDAWSENWGSLPITEEEAKDIANSLKIVLDSSIAFFALVDGEPAGVCLAVPNINEALYGLNGLKNPFEIIKFLSRLKKIKSFRLIIFGVKKKFRKTHPYLPLFMVGEVINRGKSRGYNYAEMSWTLEDNERINKLIQIVGARKYKVYRIYEKGI